MKDWTAPLACVALLGLWAGPAGAETDLERAQADELHALRRDLNVVVDELQDLRQEMGVPEKQELVSTYGLGPAASKVYGATQGISFGGYAEAVYRNRVGDARGDGDDFADFVRAVLYTGYKFNDWIVFNSEIEFEHASTSGAGSVSVEFAAVDFLLDPRFNVRAGLVLIPMGFVNEIHEPPFYFGTQRPEVERNIIPSTWRENGVGIFGALGERFQYRMYVVNGLDASGFSSSGLRGGRQRGSEAKAEDLAFVARADVDVIEGLSVGGSFYLGNSGHDQRFTQPGSGTVFKIPHVRTRIVELHSQYRRGPLQLRGLFAQADLSDTTALTNILDNPMVAGVTPIAERMIGGYGEVGYSVMPLIAPGSEYGLELFFRYEYLDTQNRLSGAFMRDRRRPRRLFIPGIQFRPHPNIVVKLDYRNIDTWGPNTGDEVSLGLGLVF